MACHSIGLQIGSNLYIVHIQLLFEKMGTLMYKICVKHMNNIIKVAKSIVFYVKSILHSFPECFFLGTQFVVACVPQKVDDNLFHT